MMVFNDIQMTKKAVKRVMKKKKQMKKQVKKHQQQEQPQMMRPPMMMGYGQQMYGNADGTIKKLQNLNQTTSDQLHSMALTIQSLQNEKKKNEDEAKELKKQHKKVEHEFEKSKTDLEIEQDKANDIETKYKRIAYFNDKKRELEKDIIEQEGENNRLAQMKELEEKKQLKHKQETINIKRKQEIEANKLAAEMKAVEDDTNILIAKNKASFDYMNTEKFIRPSIYLPKAYIKNMKEKEINDLLNTWTELAIENKKMKEIYDNYDDASDVMIEQIKHNINEQNKIKAMNQYHNQLMNNQQAVCNHLLDVQKKAINDTNDFDIENKMLSYQFIAVKKQPELYKATQEQLEKKAKAQVENDKLKRNLEILKQRKNIQIENAAMLATSNEEEKINKNGDVFQSTYKNQIEDSVMMMKSLNDEQERHQLLEQRKAEEQRHKEVMAAEKAHMNVITNNDNDDKMVSLQTNYQIEERNRIEENEMLNKLQCQEIIESITKIKQDKDPYANVWSTYLHYYLDFPYVSETRQLNNIKNIDELNEIKSLYEEKIAKASPEFIFNECSHRKPKPKENFEEEEEEFVRVADEDKENYNY